MPKIAISYRRADSAQIAGRMRDRLAAQYGKDSIFMDVYNIPIGSNFPEHIRKVWSEAAVLLVLIGPHWLGSAAQFWPRLVAWYLALPTFLLLVAHYVVVNALDLHSIYLRLITFAIPLPFGAFFFLESRTRSPAVFLVAAVLGVVATFAMTVSVSLRFHQPIVPANAFEWWENIEFAVSIALGFLAGYVLVQLPAVSSWFDKKDDWVRVEVKTALAKPIPIIPVLVDGALMPTPAQLPRSIRSMGYCTATEVRSGSDFDSQMARLIAGIDKILAERLNQRRPAADTLKSSE